MPNKQLAGRMSKIAEILAQLYPNPRCALDYTCPLELLIATILSAQCTDKRINIVTKTLFKKYRSAADYAQVSQEEFESDIQSTGFFRNKAKNIRECCAILVEKYNGEVPSDREQLESLPGVGHKTANVVLGNAFGIVTGIPVDTHVIRLSNRWQLVETENPVKIEQVLMDLNPQETWFELGHQIIMHGRAVCVARSPRCEQCPMADFCPKVGVK